VFHFAAERHYKDPAVLHHLQIADPLPCPL
jgi:hypothetical protein